MDLSIDLIFLAISIVAGLMVSFRRNSPYFLKILTIVLVINFIIDTIATILLYNDYYTTEMYSIYNIFSFEFYLYILYSIIKSQKAKRIMVYILVGFPIFWFVNLFFIQGFHNFQSISYALGCLLIVSFSIFYFFELFQHPISVKLINEPAFWLTSGLLFYYCCIFPFAAMLNFVGSITDFISYTYQKIILVINILLYSLFTIGFLCRLKIRKYIL